MGSDPVTGKVVVALNPPDGPRGYLGIELTRAPVAPGGYYLGVRSVGSTPYRIRPAAHLHQRSSSEHELEGSFVFFTVLGGEILDENFARREVFNIDDVTTLYVRVLGPDLGPALAVSVSAMQSGELYHSVDLDLPRLARVSGSGLALYLAPFIAVPTTYAGDVGALPLPYLYVPVLEFELLVERRVGATAAGTAHAAATASSLAAAAGRGVHRIVFPDLPLASGQPGIRILASNCPDANPGCTGLPLPHSQQFFGPDDRPGVRFDLRVEAVSGRLPGVNPAEVEWVVEVVDPESEAWYDDEDPAENSGNDNLELLDQADPAIPPAYPVVQVSGGGCAGALGQDARLGDRFYSGGCPEPDGPAAWKASLFIGGLSNHPGDNYQLHAFIRMKSSASVWQAAGKTHALSQPLTIWDRLFIEDDSTYERGMLLAQDLPAGGSQIVALAADFGVGEQEERKARAEFACGYHHEEVGCCVSDPQQGLCERPTIQLISGQHPLGYPAKVKEVNCSLMPEGSRHLSTCRADLLDPAGQPLSSPAALRVSEGAGFGWGAALSLPAQARANIVDNFQRLFFETVFMSDHRPDHATSLPKLPKMWAELGVGWHWEQIRKYFDNNNPGGPRELPTKAKNFLHLVTAADYNVGSSSQRAFGLAWFDHQSMVFPTMFMDDTSLPLDYRISTWTHELMHHFELNHCMSEDHCDENSNIVVGAGPNCLMNVLGFHSGYLGIECAVPTSSRYGRLYCSTDPRERRYARWNHFLNQSGP